MPIQSTPGVLVTEPAGQLRLDVAAENGSSSVQASANGVLVKGHYGAEAAMHSLADGSGYVGIATNTILPLPFAVVDQDFSEFNDFQQCDAASGVFTAQAEGLYELGAQVLVTGDGATTPAWLHCQLGIWTDWGFSGLPLNPAAFPFGTANGPVGQAWQRVGQKSMGAFTIDSQHGSTLPDAPGVSLSASAMWLVTGTIAMPSFGSPAPCRFRFSVRTDALGTAQIIGSNPRQTYAWMRWLRP